MYVFINALILALLVPLAETARAEDGPACRAELVGATLRTTLDLPHGVAVEGPWRVLNTDGAEMNDTQVVLHATLDRVIETDALTGDRNIIRFPAPVVLAFEGADRAELMHRAAQVWCMTVLRAQENRSLDHLSPAHHHATSIT